MSDPTFHPVYKSMNKPLTIWGVERRLFFLALFIGAAAFNLFGSFMTGVVMFAVLYGFAHWATRSDPQILRILFNASKYRRRYDPLKRDEFIVEIVRHD